MAILVVDDSQTTRKILARILGRHGYEVHEAACAMEALGQVKDDVDLIVLDYMMPEMNGMELMKHLNRHKNPIQNIPIIMMTAHGSVENAVEAMKNGAADYIEKPLNFPYLLQMIEANIKASKKIRERVPSPLKSRNPTLSYSMDQWVQDSEVSKQLIQEVQMVLNTPYPILISGETGTGKEVLAQTIHYNSVRRQENFMALNCAAIPENLLESELFGYEKGAFTGANRSYKGKIEQAQNGTLFLDEIGEMPRNLQAKILRVLQEREYQSIGGEKFKSVLCQIISATNVKLPDHIEKDQFREDLYYRLAVLDLHIPPLRDRREDIPGLVRILLKKIAWELHSTPIQMSPDVLEHLASYDWPGNIRQLENTLRRAVVISKGQEIQKHLILQCGENLASLAPEKNPEDSAKPLGGWELDALRTAYQTNKGNITQAAKQLGIGRTTFYRKLKKHNLILQ